MRRVLIDFALKSVVLVVVAFSPFRCIELLLHDKPVFVSGSLQGSEAAAQKRMLGKVKPKNQQVKEGFCEELQVFKEFKNKSKIPQSIFFISNKT